MAEKIDGKRPNRTGFRAYKAFTKPDIIDQINYFKRY
jgi:hypothetical protein